MHCAYIKFFLKKYCSGLVEGVNLIFRIVCQISGQDNISANPKIKLQKVTVEIFVSTRVLFAAAILTIGLRL